MGMLSKKACKLGGFPLVDSTCLASQTVLFRRFSVQAMDLLMPMLVHQVV
jgi:hypothetical protein